MKSFACIVLLAGLVAAEPPSYRSRFFQRQEAEPTTRRNEEAPYPAAGYQPSKEFKLPSRQEAAPPATSYGVPSDSYAVPSYSFRAPQEEYGTPRRSEEPERREPERRENEDREREEVENLKVEGLRKETKGKLQEAEVVNNNGAYYVLLPDLQLQRVQYHTQNDVRNMAYTARLQYRNEDRAPIYVYTSVPQPQYQNADLVQVY